MTTNQPITIEQAITRCNQELALSPNTERSYRNALKRFTEFLQAAPDTLIDQLTIDDFIRFVFWLMKQELSKSSMLAYKAGVSNFLDWLILNQYITVTVESKLRYTDACKKLARKHEAKLPEIISEEDMQKVIAAAHKRTGEPMKGIYEPIPMRDLAIVLLLDSSGLRVSELTSLSVGDIDMAECKIRITGKGSKDEYVKFDGGARAAILEYWQLRGYAQPTDPAFASHDKSTSKAHAPMTASGVRHMMDDLSKLSGVKIHPHAFRHHFGITVLRQTNNLALTQDMMRHSSPTVTRRYATITNQERDAEYDKIFGK